MSLTYPNTIPGQNIAVSTAERFHSFPFIVLYNRAEKQPAMSPIKTYSMMATLISAPRELGDNIPNIAMTVKGNLA